jgi:hypothetical protein
MHGHTSTHSTPRWVKMFGIAVIGLLALFIGLHLIGGTPFAHMFDRRGHHTQSPSGTEHRLQQP